MTSVRYHSLTRLPTCYSTFVQVRSGFMTSRTSTKKSSRSSMKSSRASLGVVSEDNRSSNVQSSNVHTDSRSSQFAVEYGSRASLQSSRGHFDSRSSRASIKGVPFSRDSRASVDFLASQGVRPSSQDSRSSGVGMKGSRASLQDSRTSRVSMPRESTGRASVPGESSHDFSKSALPVFLGENVGQYSSTEDFNTMPESFFFRDAVQSADERRSVSTYL